MSVTSQDEEDVPVGNTTPQESETPEQESPDQPEPTNPEPAETIDPTEMPNNSETNGNGQNPAHVEPEPEKRYPCRVRQQPQRYM